MNTLLPAIALIIVAAVAWPAWGACTKEEVRGGIDRSMPCILHSPVPQEFARVEFARESSDLGDEAKAILDRQAEILRRYPGLAMTVWGHVDHEEARLTGGQALGYQRADAVRDYLVARGVAPERISTDSRGNRWAIPMEPLSEAALASMRFAGTETEDNR